MKKFTEQMILDTPVRRVSIEGYSFNAILLPVAKEWTFHAPIGDTEREKEMFDALVYRNKSIYQGHDFYDVVENIRQFIIKNK